MQRKGSGCAVSLPILIITVVAAALLAAGLFLGIPYLRNRPQFPRGTFEFYVEGNLIRVEMDPNQEVTLLQPFINPNEPGTGGQASIQVATATPGILLPTPGTPAPTLPPVVPTVPNILPSLTPRPATACIIFTDYAVQSGDTLFSISRKFVTSIPLMARHGISSTSLTPGAIIRVPVGDPACCANGWRPYVVMEGDTWFSIAQRCGITIDALYGGNGVGPGAMLYMASVICVP